MRTPRSRPPTPAQMLRVRRAMSCERQSIRVVRDYSVIRHSKALRLYPVRSETAVLGVADNLMNQPNVVGETGFEPATLWSQTRCATRLRYSPTIGPPRRSRRPRQVSMLVGPAGKRQVCLSKALACPPSPTSPQIPSGAGEFCLTGLGGRASANRGPLPVLLDCDPRREQLAEPFGRHPDTLKRLAIRGRRSHHRNRDGGREL